MADEQDTGAGDEPPAKRRRGRPSTPPEELLVTASDEAGRVMAIEHRELPITAVQFHPESILTAEENLGMRLISNTMETLATQPRRRVSRTLLPS